MKSLKKFAKLLWLTSGVLLIMLFIYQATPILLNSFDPSSLRLIAIFLTFFAMCIAMTCAILLFSWLTEELKTRKHKLTTRRKHSLTNRENSLSKISIKINGQQISLDVSNQVKAQELLERFRDLHPTIEEVNS
jgi:magnesium-transporting ATPase (P-type)